MKTILVLNRFFKFSNNDLYELRKKHKTNDHVFSILPKYTINNDTKNIVPAEYYLQFIGQIKSEM